ncbi:MAG: hypothetical protein JRN59_08400 [Nitrososphaerota archaeon]|nr:hypothetical protein [Nitrososphaerota archaeon]
MRSIKPEFRHGAGLVGVATLSGQFYCEYKVENEFALGEVPSEVKESGTDLHDELMPIEEIAPEDFARLVSEKGPNYAVLGLWGVIGGLRLVGMPDHMIWSYGSPIWLMELKTTRGDPNLLWRDQEIQARIYGLLLDSMGFDCSNLKLAVVRLRSGALDDGEKGDWIAKVSRALVDGTIEELEREHRGSMKIDTLRHEKSVAEAAVAAKRGYWIGEREPTSSESIAKCRACEYNKVCVKSLTRPKW